MGAVAWGLWPALRFPSPLIKPNVPISGIRLSDWLHHKAHDGRPLEAGVARRHLERNQSSPCGMSFLRPVRIVVGVCRLIANHLHLTVFESVPKSQGPLLRRHYPASTLIRPCPTPVLAAAFRNVEAATLADERVSPDYPNHLSDVPCPLPRRIERVRVSIASHAHWSLPQIAGGSAFALSLSRPAQASLTLRPAGSLGHPR